VRALRLSAAAPGWVLLAVALGAAAYSAARVPSEALGPTEITYRLQAESLARDGDLAYEERDRLRFAERPWTDREDKVLVSHDRDGLRYQSPLPYALALAPFVRIAPARGPAIFNLLILIGLALALCVWVSRDNPKSAPYWAVALLFGTPVFAYARAAWAELFVGSLLVVAYWLTRDRAPADELPQMARLEASPVGGTVRWIGVGVLSALAALHEPLLVAFFVAFLILAYRSRVVAAWAPAVGGFAFVLLAVWFTGGPLVAGGVTPWTPDTALAARSGDSIEEVGRWAERVESVEAPEFVLDPLLWLWNGVYTFGGRNVGVLAAFLPLVLFAATGRWRRGLLWAAAAAVALLALTLDPFNFFGGPEALGNRRLLPALIVCFFAVRASRSVWPALLAASLGFVVIAPLWLDLGAHPRSLRTTAVLAPIAARLPFETSQRYVPVSGEAVSRLLLVRTVNDGIDPGSGRAQFVLRGDRRGELMVATAGPLAYLDLEFGAGAGTELALEGGVVKDLLFRPDGGVTFRLHVEDALIRHSVWGRENRHDVYMLKLSMPGGGSRDHAFSISAEGSG